MGNRNSYNSEKRSIWGWIQYVTGFYKNPPYIEDRLREADVRSAMYLTVSIIGMEIWLLIRYVNKYVVTGMCETVGEFFHYTYSYWILLLASLILFIYSVLYMRGKLNYMKRFSRPIIFLFFSLGIYFGISTSLNDFSKGRMITCFLSMIMYVTFIFVVRPYISLLLMAVSGVGFILICNNFAFDREGNRVVMGSGDLVNYITFFLSLTVLTLTIYFQRYGDAQKAYKLETAAITDALTGAPNMTDLSNKSEEYIRKSLAENTNPVFLIFNIVNFQTYNDRFGYSGGNKLLKNMSVIIRNGFYGDPFARQLADKFIVLTNKEDYVERVERIRENFKNAFASETYLDIKVGSYRPANSEVEPRHAVDRARYAMGLMKNREDVLIAEYDDALRRNYELRQHILNNLDTAIKEGYIKAYYQPVVDARTGLLCGCEALARWIDPELGFLSPGQFIPILEESRQIHKLDRKVYENVISNMRESLNNNVPVLPASLNFSRLDFELMDAVEELEKLVNKYNISKKLLHVEITESALTENEEGLQKAVDTLHEKGYEVWLDDFGSGYSSMNVLKDFDFDMLKIDMVFLKNFSGNQNSRRIIKAIINLANELGMQTLTEGVETGEAVDFLREAGCDRLQGYFYGKPQTYEEILEKINDGTYKLA
ncbi:MAG: EAL domain-containing protein [Lachnospiraceae bacterium]|nr:EAL domain-containing protein [Lachnospiraceae bacterium]